MRALILIAAVWAGLCLPVTQAHAETPSLDAAYQKEFAYLKAEKEALEQRLVEEKQRAASALSKSRGELDRLQGKLVRLQTQAETSEDSLRDVERSAQVAMEGEEMVSNAIFQASSSLEREGFALPEAQGEGLEPQAPVLAAAFAEGLNRISEGRSVRTESGTYFLQDGTQVQGDVLVIGNVASYGLSNAGSGALKPVGQGRVQLWRDGGTDTASAAKAGALPETLGIFLYESTKKGITEAPEKTWAGYVEAGGPAGLVIIGLGFLAIVLVALRTLSLMLVGGSGQSFVEQVADKLRAGEDGAALALAKKGRGAVGRIAEAVVANFARPRNQLEDVVGEAILREQPKVDRFSTAILVIAAVAPLMGLLGTVTGMIATFDIITEFGTGDPRRLSGGISEALVTTQLGLIVAIPALLVGNILSSWGNGVMGRLERSALHLLNVQRHEDPRPTSGGEDEERPQLREVGAGV